MHRELFIDIYDWAGQVRTVDISKADTRFCNVGRIRPEADKLFHARGNGYGEWRSAGTLHPKQEVEPR